MGDARTGHAGALARRAVSAGTLRAYAADWTAFAGWCALQDLQALPAQLDTVLRYLLKMEADSKVSSQRRRLVAIRRTHREHGHELDVTDPDFQRGWLAISGRDRSDKRPRRRISHDEVATLVGALPGGLVGVRDRALILLGYATGCRPSELIGLDCADVELTPRLIRVRLRPSRARAAIPRTLDVARHSDRGLCAPRWLKVWMDEARITDGPLFRPVNRHGHMAEARLSVQAVRIIVRRAAQRAELPDPALCGDGWRPLRTATH